MVQLIIIVVYMAVMAAIGFMSLGKVKSSSGFFVLNRSGSTLYITGSLVATIVGASATIGMAGLGFSRGLTGAWWLLVGSIGLIILGIFFAKRVREYGLFTLPELVGKQYGKHIGLAASILIVLAWFGVIAGQIIASGKILSVLGYGTPQMWMLIFTAVFTCYTLIGGQYAVIRTDVIQAAIIFIGILGSLALLLPRLGGLSGLVSSLPPAKFSFPLSSNFGIIDLVSYLLLIGLTYVVGPDMYSRLFCAKDARTAKASALWAAFLIIPIAFGVTIIGMGASILSPKALPEQAFPTVMTQVLPPFVSGIVLAALISAVMSSADTCLLSASTIFTVDIVKFFKPSLSEKQVLTISRWVILVFGLFSLLLALVLKGVINSLMFAYTIFTAGVIIPVIFGFYRDKLKLTPAGALAAIIGGGLTGFIAKAFAVPIQRFSPYLKYLDLGALLISLVLLFGVSFIHQRFSKANLDASATIK